MKRNIKACLLDFDGTLTTKDMLTVITGIAGKLEESQKLGDQFIRGEIEGLDALVARINLLAGVSVSDIEEFLDKDRGYMPGLKELMRFFRDNDIITIVASGNIIPVLRYYQKILGFDYVVGSNTDMDGDKILGIRRESYPSLYFKKDGINKILETLNIEKENIVAIGDGPGDKQMFEMAGYSIAFNPQGGIEKSADTVVEGDLNKVMEVLRNL